MLITLVKYICKILSGTVAENHLKLTPSVPRLLRAADAMGPVTVVLQSVGLKHLCIRVLFIEIRLLNA